MPSVKHNWADETEGIDGGVGKEKEKKKRKTGIVSNPLTTNTTLLPTTHFSLRSIHTHIYIYKERPPLAKLYFPSARRNLHHHLLFLPPNEPFSSSLTCQFFSLPFFLPSSSPLPRFRSFTSRSIILSRANNTPFFLPFISSSLSYRFFRRSREYEYRGVWFPFGMVINACRKLAALLHAFLSAIVHRRMDEAATFVFARSCATIIVIIIN